MIKLQRGTLVLVLLALSLGGFVYFYEVQGAPQRQTAQLEEQPIFAFKEEQVQSFTIKTGKQTLSFVKNSQPPQPSVAKGPQSPSSEPKSVWQMKAPTAGPASDASVAYLLNLLATGRSSRLTVPSAKRQEFGLEPPQATIEVKLDNQQTHRLVLGKANFNRTSLYAQADPSASSTQDSTVLLVPIDFENAVNRPLAEWQNKSSTPAKPTQSPSPKPTR